MTEKRDAELFITKYVDILKANLNEKIDEINAEKNDGMTLEKVDNNAYYFQTFGGKAPAYNPAILFGVTTEIRGTMKGLADESLLIATELVVSDKAELDSMSVMKRIQRYRRALQEVITDNHDKFPNLEMESLPDIPFTIQRSHYLALGIGVKITY